MHQPGQDDDGHDGKSGEGCCRSRPADLFLKRVGESGWLMPLGILLLFLPDVQPAPVRNVERGFRSPPDSSRCHAVVRELRVAGSDPRRHRSWAPGIRRAAPQAVIEAPASPEAVALRVKGQRRDKRKVDGLVRDRRPLGRIGFPDAVRTAAIQEASGIQRCRRNPRRAWGKSTPWRPPP